MPATSTIEALELDPAAVPSFPPLRLLPIPPCEPPYDDLGVPGSVASRPAAAPPPAPLARPAPLQLVTPAPSAAAPVAATPASFEDADSDRTPLSELPPLRPFALALVQRLLEVMAGVRPVAQLQRDTSFELFGRLEATLPRAGWPGTLRPDRRAVRSLHLQTRPEGVAEICATVQRGGRLAAFALRAEGVNGRWTCMELAGV